MNGQPIARLVRTLRRRMSITQQELSERSAVPRWRVVRIESGSLDRLRVEDLERTLAALGARFYVGASYHGAEADRVIDEVHATLVAACVGLLRHFHWEVRVEVSFSEFGDRGSIDVLAWHSATRTLLVIEVKSELGSIEGTLRPLDVKVRLASKIARERFGWNAMSIGRILLFPENRTVRRQVDSHATVLRAALPSRSRELRAWLGHPVGPIAGIWFLTNVPDLNDKRNISAIRRVRKVTPRSRDAG